MAQKYYNIARTAEILGIGEDDVKQMQARSELRGYRDGTDWKFRVEDIDRLSEERRQEQADMPEAEEGDVLLSEVNLGGAEAGASGTVIGMPRDAQPETDSDIKISEGSGSLDAGQDDVGSKVSQFEELDLTLEEDLTLEDSSAVSTGETPSGGSDIDLGGRDPDDDLVLGGSSTGSDITIGGDSGISLVDPADSGLSLEEPVELAGSAESLELGEDDMIALSEDAEAEVPVELKTDDDFLLTPADEAEEEESESGSQVIALETEGEGEEAAAMSSGGGMAAMLDEDLGAEVPDDLGVAATMEAAPLGAQQVGLAEGAPATQAAAAVLPEAPYSVWDILSLALCTIFLVLCGIFMYDLLRNMWSWESTYSVNSSLMDTILGWFGD